MTNLRTIIDQVADLPDWLSEDVPPPAEPPKAVSLSAYLGVIAEQVKALGLRRWVHAEISRMNDRNHVYLELVEHDPAGREIAKASGVIWRGRRAAIFSRFAQGTGGALAAGMKVMFAVEPVFSAQYGFSLVITDIEPAFTVGEMQRKLMRMRETLKREGRYDANRAHAAPVEFTRVAVISPDRAAGLGDFRQQADVLHEARLCTFEYFTATFQGQEARATLLAALHAVAARAAEAPGFDALVIIRGGGAQTDLAWLNEEALARAVCDNTLPVFTGIGHQQDNTILDEVAHTRFDTPSKVIGHILATVTRNATAALEHWREINALAEARVAGAQDKLAAAADWLAAKGRAVLDTAEQEAKGALAAIAQAASQQVDRAGELAARDLADVRLHAYAQLESARRDSEALGAEVVGLGPAHTLARGYAIVRSAGHAVSSVTALAPGTEVEIQFHDGRGTATVPEVPAVASVRRRRAKVGRPPGPEQP